VADASQFALYFEQKATYPGFINWPAKEILGMIWGNLT